MQYKNELRVRIKKSGRTRNWISEQMGISRVTFWRKVNNDTLSKDEKNKLNDLLK